MKKDKVLSTLAHLNCPEYKDLQGYIHIKYKGKWMRKHRVIASLILGRELARGEQVHHINHIKDDNRIENLVVLQSSTHRRLHMLNNIHVRKNMDGRRCDICQTDKTNLQKTKRGLRPNWYGIGKGYTLCHKCYRSSGVFK